MESLGLCVELNKEKWHNRQLSRPCPPSLPDYIFNNPCLLYTRSPWQSLFSHYIPGLIGQSLPPVLISYFNAVYGQILRVRYFAQTCCDSPIATIPQQLTHKAQQRVTNHRSDRYKASNPQRLAHSDHHTAINPQRPTHSEERPQRLTHSN